MTSTRIAWVAGWNQPGCLPDNQPVQCESWTEAWSFLRAEIGEHFIEKVDTDPPEDEARTMGAYTEASATIRDARPMTPFSIVYDGLVWWVADLPVDDTPVQ